MDCTFTPSNVGTPTDLDLSWPMIQNMSSLKGELGETNTGHKGEYVEYNNDIVMAGNTTN
ncbi:hypothetical protein AZF07_00730 [Corynebacterium diphtheriae subsp. lausannense]|nr:hypothetical protein AZF07_00730 [Corynebacterium diphtheriae subsp. lausannense]